jgi:hypothetical protein
MYVSSVSSGCYIYMHVARIRLQVFQVFNTYVASVLSGCCIYFAMTTHVFFKCFRRTYKCFSCFGRMLQVFHLGVAKVDLGLHTLQQNPPIVAAYCSCWGTVHVRGKRRGMEAGARHGRSQEREIGVAGVSCMRRVQEAEGNGRRRWK